MKTFILGVFLLPAMLFVSCATLKVDKPAVSGVKKVAVVGFAISQEKPAEWSLGPSRKTKQWGSGLVRPAKHATEIYANLVGTLKRTFKWKVLDANSIAKNAEYNRLYEEKMKGWQSRPPSPSGFDALGADGILDPWPIERMDASERAALAKALGVEAIAVARVKIELEMGGGLERMIGAGEYKPQATTQFTLYGKDGPIWSDISAAGAAVEKGTQHVLGLTEVDALNARSVEAATKSLRTLIARYEEQK